MVWYLMHWYSMNSYSLNPYSKEFQWWSMNNTCLIESTQWDPKLRILLNGPILSGLVTRLTHARSTHTLWTDPGVTPGLVTQWYWHSGCDSGLDLILRTGTVMQYYNGWMRMARLLTDSFLTEGFLQQAGASRAAPQLCLPLGRFLLCCGKWYTGPESN